MKETIKNNETEWNNPIPLALLKLHNYEKTLEEIIEIECSRLLERIRESKPSIFSKNSSFIPVEKIVEELGIEVFNYHSTNSFGATTSKDKNKFFISLNKKNSFSYYHTRFSLAHELAHICLRHAVGPLTLNELSATKVSNHEEEILCDFFASAFLMPKNIIQHYLNSEGEISQRIINNIAKDFKVSRGMVLRRISDTLNSILLLWDKIENPLTKNSDIEQRIKQIYKPIRMFSKYFIPRYCTSAKRFEPNIIEECLINKTSKSEIVTVSNLGDLPSKKYFIHNIFFQTWSENLLNSGLIDNRQRFYNMATFIQLS